MNMFAKVLLSLLATALAPLLLVTYVTNRTSQESLLAVAGDSLEASAETLAQSVVVAVDDAVKELVSWSELDMLQVGVFMGDDQNLKLAELLADQQQRSDFSEIWCTDLAGRIVASSNYTRIDTTMSGYEPLRRASREHPFIGEIEPSILPDGEPVREIIMASPILGDFDGETVIGTIVGSFNWDKASSRSVRQSRSAVERGIRLYLADEQASFVAALEDNDSIFELLAAEYPALARQVSANGGRAHALSDGTLDGSRQVLAAVKVRGILSGMVLDGVAIAPEALVLQPARQLTAFTLATCAAAAAGIFVLALILSRNISRPLTALAATAQQIAEGDLDRSPPRVAGVETRRLAAGLDTMRLSLKRQIDTLDSSVRERTAQLEASVRQLQGEIRAREEAQRQASLREQQLRQADKMVSLGILVSGVAHEINNPNGLIALNLGLLAEVWEKALPVLDTYYREHGDFSLGPMNYSELRDQLPLMLADAAAGSERIKAIVDDLKGFSRQSEERLDDPVDVNQVVQSSVNLVSSHLKKATRHLSVVLARDLPSVYGNGRRLEQVVINLLLNSCDALDSPEGGIRISTGTGSDGRVAIEVADTGRGIAEEDMPRITDPFFTTRRTAGGTGLGLSISAGIIEEHGGELVFESKQGAGTTARILLPTGGRGERN
ncbi:MAG: HAMP domain-containing protein [Candidatus Hydrogenedentes bacterium]|nr:HAMP domain-containing protein [Candidatus Hydrogenedentota bacterium]